MSAMQGEMSENIRKTLLSFLQMSGIDDLFTRKSGRQVLCEKEFANVSGMLYRLDRVIVDVDAVTVIDFKTGGDELEKEYREQVRNYISLLKDVYPEKKVAGTLAYVDMHKIQTVA